MDGKNWKAQSRAQARAQARARARARGGGEGTALSAAPAGGLRASVDPTAQTRYANGADWQEEVYQKIKSMKEMYLPKLNDLYHKVASEVQQCPQHEKIEKFKVFKLKLEYFVLLLQLNKHDIQLYDKEKLLSVEKHINFFLKSNNPPQPDSSLLQGQLPQPPVYTSQTPMMGSGWQDIASHFYRLDDSSYGLGSKQNSFGIATSGFDRLGSSSGANLVEERLGMVEERLEKIEAHSKKAEALLTDINKKMNYPVKIRYVKVSRDIRCPAKYMNCHFRPKRKNRSGSRASIDD
ncbi:PREDICTED: probable mediator of RNA polymerase II transcription subunit 15c isoform X1 [Nicotiana attenuata]|uniref:Mediator of rna polymerase ii transcription subunit 15a n=1 Tax=Nicotiana attenuata TaxID=49451 RepID=A0A1J6IKR2_NICAT|nr:PREDICTED: probable mediator of RNA polymerase II transcription subunit 15c isoform X1 [Nicotiana attenuata]OIT05438.1 mediator of rna polymerase ii transcription subunit 15a [Nicotiana attenuata]